MGSSVSSRSPTNARRRNKVKAVKGISQDVEWWSQLHHVFIANDEALTFDVNRYIKSIVISVSIELCRFVSFCQWPHYYPASVKDVPGFGWCNIGRWNRTLTFFSALFRLDAVDILGYYDCLADYCGSSEMLGREVQNWNMERHTIGIHRSFSCQTSRNRFSYPIWAPARVPSCQKTSLARGCDTIYHIALMKKIPKAQEQKSTCLVNLNRWMIVNRIYRRSEAVNRVTF